jgi:quinol monooxygenase YgiN
MPLFTKERRALISGPIVLISHHKVKEGKLDDYIQLYREVVLEIKAAKPGTLTHSAYTNEDGSEVSHVHVILDDDAMDAHLQGVSDRTNLAYQYIEPRAMEVYGTLSESALGFFKKIEESGVVLTYYPHYHDGYLRLVPGG